MLEFLTDVGILEKRGFSDRAERLSVSLIVKFGLKGIGFFGFLMASPWKEYVAFYLKVGLSLEFLSLLGCLTQLIEAIWAIGEILDQYVVELLPVFSFLIRVELSLPVPAATIILKELLDSLLSSNYLDLVTEQKVTFLECLEVWVKVS